jgi:hypothetical protein
MFVDELLANMRSLDQNAKEAAFGLDHTTEEASPFDNNGTVPIR